jgi:hemolysin activation/secretion protein
VSKISQFGNFVSICSFLVASVYGDSPSQELPSENNKEQSETVAAPVIKGIVIVSSCDKLLPPEEVKDVQGVKSVDVALPDGTYRLQDRLYHKVNAPFCKEWLEEVKREIMEYYKDCNRPFMVVEIPEQDITDGVVQLVVKEGKIGKIRCTGNEYYPEEYFADILGLHEGNQILYDVLADSVAWLGMHPFSQAQLVFKPGENEGEVDVEIIAQDRKPWKVFAGVDDSGTKTTDYGRWFAGGIVDNVFKAGGVLSFQYKGSYDCEKLQSYLGSYMVPLRCGHIFSAYGGYATTKPNIHDFHSSGNFTQVSLGYSIPLKWRMCQWTNNIGFGLNVKRLNNNLLFVDDPETPIIDGGVNITQLQVSYNYGRHHSKHSVSFSSELVVSPGDVIAQESNHDYQKLQNGAHSLYAYLNFGGDYIFYLPHEVTLLLKGIGQAATGTLLPSEQMQLGGAQSVRGYDPGEYLADNALGFTTELFAPPINFKLGKTKKTRGYLLFLGFLDSAVGNQYHPITGTRKVDYLIGMGPGLRFNIVPYLEFDLSWGYKFHRVKGGVDKDQRFYFSLTGSF